MTSTDIDHAARTGAPIFCAGPCWQHADKDQHKDNQENQQNGASTHDSLLGGAFRRFVADRIDGNAEKQCSRRTVCDLCADELIGQRSAARKSGQGRTYYY
jgi:hypothetical protein